MEKTNIMGRENKALAEKKSVKSAADISAPINTSAMGKENEAHGLLTRYGLSPNLLGRILGLPAVVS